MAQPRNIRFVKPGERPEAKHLNEIIAAVNGLLRGGPGEDAIVTGTGTYRRKRMSSACVCNDIHQFFNSPLSTAGTFSATYTVRGVTAAVSWAWNASASTVQTAFEGHGGIEAGEVDVTGGPWPAIAIAVEFKEALAGHRIVIVSVSNASLTTGKGIMSYASRAPEDTEI